uniref:Uncharacterized protein n=1 Tax=Anguilla anguilla TaxID=7936 RepID=A0A0E9UTM8_ANGAN
MNAISLSTKPIFITAKAF